MWVVMKITPHPHCASWGTWVSIFISSQFPEKGDTEELENLLTTCPEWPPVVEI